MQHHSTARGITGDMKVGGPGPALVKMSEQVNIQERVSWYVDSSVKDECTTLLETSGQVLQIYLIAIVLPP